MKHLLLSLLAILIIQGSYSQTEPILKIGLVADPQYADKPAAGERFYRESLWKLKEAIKTFNDCQVDFVQNLGDIIDEGWENYNSIIPVYQHLDSDIENFHLLGNHDFAIDSSHQDSLLAVLSMPCYYYSYVRENWRFIVLDATDYSYFSMWLHGRDPDQVDKYYLQTEGKPNHYRWNSAIGECQKEWLEQELKSAGSLQQKVIIFSHVPLRPLNEPENLWNSEEILEIIEKSPVVVAFINGHNHSGDYIFKNGIHYITIFGMVDTMKNACGILEIYENRLVLKGFGNQRSLELIRNR